MKQNLQDLSNGYDDESERFIANRSPVIGVSTVRSWAKSLAVGSIVLDLGCGDGIPITQTLLHEGLKVHADVSLKMVSAFSKNFPNTPVMCQAAEQLHGINQRFDAVIAWGTYVFVDTRDAKVCDSKC